MPLPRNAYELGEMIRTTVPEELDRLGINRELHPYEIVRQLQANRSKDPGLDRFLKGIEGSPVMQSLPEAPGAISTFAKTAGNALGFGLPDYLAREHGIGLDPITDEQAKSGAGIAGEVGGSLAGFIVPGMAAVKAARYLPMLAKGAGVLRSAEAAQKAGMGLGAARAAHGAAMAGVGAAQGIGRSTNAQNRQIEETGTRQSFDTDPLAMEALGNALVAPFGGGITAKLLGKGARLAPGMAKLKGAALGATKATAGMGALGTAQAMNEDPKLSMEQAAGNTLGEIGGMNLMTAAPILGALAGGGKLGGMVPALSGQKGLFPRATQLAEITRSRQPGAGRRLVPPALARARTKWPAEGAPTTSPAASAAAEAVPPPNDLTPPSSYSEVTDLNELRQLQQAEEGFGPVQRAIANLRNMLNTVPEAARDFAQAAKWEPQAWRLSTGEIANLAAGKGNRYGNQAARLAAPGANEAKTLSMGNVKPNATGWYLKVGGKPYLVDKEYTRVNRPFEYAHQGKKYMIRAIGPNDSLAEAADGTLVQIPRMTPEGTVREGFKGAPGDTSLAAGVESAITARTEAKNARKMATEGVPGEPPPLRTREFNKLRDIIANVMSMPDHQDIIKGLMEDNPDLAPYIRSIAKVAPRKPRAPKNPKG